MTKRSAWRDLIPRLVENTTPNVAYEQTGVQKKMWKNKKYRKNEQSSQIDP